MISPAENDVTVSTPAAPESCPACGSGGSPAPTSYIYAAGRVGNPVFPLLSVEKEFAQAIGRAETTGYTDQETLYKALSQPANRYLARQMCWPFSVQGLDTYLLQPRHSEDFDQLIAAIRPKRSPLDIDVVVGIRGPIAPPEYCNGLMLPIVAFDQIYSFDRDSLIKAIPRARDVSEAKFRTAAAEIYDRLIQITDNAGASDEHRASNYLAGRYGQVFTVAADAFARDFSLTAVEARPSPLSGTRRIVDVIFVFTNRKTDFVEKHMVRVDVTEEFPFLVAKLAPYYDR